MNGWFEIKKNLSTFYFPNVFSKPAKTSTQKVIMNPNTALDRVVMGAYCSMFQYTLGPWGQENVGGVQA